MESRDRGGLVLLAIALSAAVVFSIVALVTAP